MCPPASPHAIRVDTHVHLHPRFDAGAFLDAAAAHATPAGLVLCLTECAGVRRFDELARTPSVGRWTLELISEPESLAFARTGTTITLIAGRQIITAERIEVLALATLADFDDGCPLAETLDAVLNAGAIAVLPWGFGKWWGGRGRLVADELRRRGRTVMVGDNAGRPRGSRPHPIFRLARELGVPVLPGSDPLDLAHHLTRAGSYGLELPAPLDALAPAADLRARLREPPASPPVSGRRIGPARFALDQALLRLRRAQGVSA